MKKTLRKFISIILSISIIVGISSVSSFAFESEETVEYAMGLIVEESYDIDKNSIALYETYDALPTSVDLTSEFPTPGNQGNQESCVAWAVAYALVSANEAAKRDWSISSTAHHFSPAYIYNQINGGVDEGAKVTDALDCVIEQGVCSVNYFPYDPNDYTTQPTEIQREAAAMYKATGRDYVGMSSMKKYLSEGKGVLIGINVYSDFLNLDSSNDVYDVVYGDFEGAHTICLIGYDDNKNAFKFINSWGTGWGVGGYGWISYDLVDSAEVNNIAPGVGLVLISEEEDDYILGDVNDDGVVTAIDARTALTFVSENLLPTARQFVMADVDGDAQITALDSRYILQYASELRTKMPLYD